MDEDWTSSWRPSIDGALGTKTVSIRLFTPPLSSHGKLANGGQSCRESHKQLKLHSGVNS
jgi:hypothetical protein